MEKELQRIAIAQACGWTWEGEFNSRKEKNRLVCPDGTKVCTVWRNGTLGGSLPPEYLSDLNAMHEAEKILDDTQRLPGFPNNEHITQLDIYYSRLEGVIESAGSPRYEFQASASQRAEAFLRTLNLWTTA